MPNRKKATNKAIMLLSKFAGYNDTVKETENMLNSLTDEQFDEYMQRLQNKQSYLPYISANLSETKITSERNLEIAKEIGVSFFERLYLTDPSTGQTYLTPLEYMVIDLPIKRLQQHLEKKLNAPDNARHIDDRTGQPAQNSVSSGSKLSYPELQTLYSQGLDQTIRETFNVRGGDESSFREFERQAVEMGFPSLDASEDPDSVPKSSEVLGILLKAMHIDNNLAEK